MYRVATYIFFILLCVPLLLLMVGSNKNVLVNENRVASEFPKFDMKHPGNFIEDFNAYFSDNFGLRQGMFTLYSNMKFNVLGEDPLPLKMFEGKNEFYFLGESTDNVLSESLGINLFTQEELQTIAHNIHECRRFLLDYDITFYIAVAPNKHTIYKEYLPFRLNTTQTKFLQLKDYLEAEGFTQLIDLSESLLPVKDSIRLYHKTNTHWNEVGAYYASQQIINTLNRDLKVLNPLQFSDYTLDTVTSYSEDLSQLIGQEIKEQRLHLSPKKNIQSKADTSFHAMATKSGKATQVFYSDVNDISMVVFRDSFSTDLIDFLRKSFGKSVFLWTPFIRNEQIKRYEPNVVIYQVVERNIDNLLTFYRDRPINTKQWQK